MLSSSGPSGGDAADYDGRRRRACCCCCCRRRRLSRGKKGIFIHQLPRISLPSIPHGFEGLNNQAPMIPSHDSEGLPLVVQTVQVTAPSTVRPMRQGILKRRYDPVPPRYFHISRYFRVTFAHFSFVLLDCLVQGKPKFLRFSDLGKSMGRSHRL